MNLLSYFELTSLIDLVGYAEMYMDNAAFDRGYEKGLEAGQKLLEFLQGIPW